MGLRGEMPEDSDKDHDADLYKESEEENTREELGGVPIIQIIISHYAYNYMLHHLSCKMSIV